jgi:hypothetical protein
VNLSLSLSLCCLSTARIAQMVKWLGYRLYDRGIRIWFPTRARDFSFLHSGHTTVGPTQPPIQWVHGGHFLWVQWLCHIDNHSPPSILCLGRIWSRNKHRRGRGIGKWHAQLTITSHNSPHMFWYIPIWFLVTFITAWTMLKSTSPALVQYKANVISLHVQCLLMTVPYICDM